ncbi:MAG TPA: methyltransferase domain-containing protein [Chitinispirillaceae bacterium]|nr:methyltransferase domain-containing protein [Chitinispirillaceae bacterium]
MHRVVKIPAKKRISHTFGLKAAQYDHYAQVQRRYQIILRDHILKTSPQGYWADLGCGTGRLLSDLKKSFPLMNFSGLDISIKSLLLFKQSSSSLPVVQGDIEKLPFKTGSLDGVVISSVLQWIYDLEVFFAQLNTTLKDSGMFYFSIFSRGSFKELSDARMSMGIPDPISLPDVQRITESLRKSSFKKISLIEDEETVYFPSAQKLLKSLSAIGSTAVAGKPMTRSQLHTFCQILEKNYCTGKGVPLTYRSILGWTINNSEAE